MSSRVISFKIKSLVCFDNCYDCNDGTHISLVNTILTDRWQMRYDRKSGPWIACLKLPSKNTQENLSQGWKKRKKILGRYDSNMLPIFATETTMVYLSAQYELKVLSVLRMSASTAAGGACAAATAGARRPWAACRAPTASSPPTAPTPAGRLMPRTTALCASRRRRR